VGYELEERTTTTISRLNGRGGINTVHFSVGFEPFKNFRLGGTINYNFGDIENKSLIFRDQIQFASRELNFIDINGLSYNLGALYRFNLNEN